MRGSPNTLTKFYALIDATKTDARGCGCWEWRGTKTPYGYGRVYIGGKSRQAHRVVACLTGMLKDLDSSACVLHSCDNRLCCRPSHLFIGDKRMNAKDRDSKNRQAKGDKHGKAKLAKRDVLRIRRKYSTGEITMQNFADLYGVSRSCIHRIVHEQSWKYLQ